MKSNTRDRILEVFKKSFETNNLHKVKLSGYESPEEDLKAVIIKPVLIKDTKVLQYVHSYATRDVTKNKELKDGLDHLEEMLSSFNNFSMVTTEHVYQWNSKTSRLFKSANSQAVKTNQDHDKQKKYMLDQQSPYLKELGITNASGNIIGSKSHKFKQINKYIEIMDSVLSSADLSDPVRIHDAGSGKGYLTFALYDYLKNTKNSKVEVTGIELRKELVEKCNALAETCKYTSLKFIEGGIADQEAIEAEVLLALHACDTATDDAIALGIKSNASVIVCSPCCHKQIRKQLSKGTQGSISPLLKYGIIKERQAEIITDVIRSLLLEAHGYKTKVMEFISSEHTPKNLLIVAVKSKSLQDSTNKLQEVQNIKKEFGIEYHYLEKALKTI